MEILLRWLSENWLGSMTLVVCLTYMFLGLPHQIWTIYKTKDVTGVSVQMFCLLSIQSFFWVLYGLQQHDRFVTIANCFATLFAAVIVVQYLLYRKKK